MWMSGKSQFCDCNFQFFIFQFLGFKKKCEINTENPAIRNLRSEKNSILTKYCCGKILTEYCCGKNPPVSKNRIFPNRVWWGTCLGLWLGQLLRATRVSRKCSQLTRQKPKNTMPNLTQKRVYAWKFTTWKHTFTQTRMLSALMPLVWVIYADEVQ